MTNYLSSVLGNLGAVFYLLLFVNVALLVFAPQIVDNLTGKNLDAPAREWRINALRILNLLAASLLLVLAFGDDGFSVENPFLKLLLAILIIYFSFMLAHLASGFIQRRYGRRVQSQDSLRIADTYASRALSISAGVFITVIALVAIVRLFGFDNLLEAGGVIGFVGVFLALTQAAWAPDIIAGLIILNTRMFEERDVIKLDDGSADIIARVYRTRAFHTELLNLIDNHRVMIRNSKIRDYTVHNLSRFATARGLRESLRFNIGYNESPERIRSLFEEAFRRASENEALKFERQHPVEVRLQDAGDYAVAWSFHYYTKDADSIIGLRQAFREIILETCIEWNIDLSTPLVVASADMQLSLAGQTIDADSTSGLSSTKA